MASKRNIRRKTCGSKVRYNKADAKQAAFWAKKRSGDIIVPYRCKYCGAYHIGHVPAVVNRILTMGIY